MTLGEATGLIGLIKGVVDSALRRSGDRPAVKVVIRVVDHQAPGPGVIAAKVGPHVYMEIHSVGPQAARVTAAGFELTDGELIEPYDLAFPVVLVRPEMTEVDMELTKLVTEMNGRKIKGILVRISPDRVHRQRMPKGWEKFPDEQPPMTKGPAGGAVFAAWA